MPSILCVESSVDYSSVCIAQGGKVLVNHNISEHFAHSKYLASAIEKVIIDAKMSFSDLDAIAISAGPGSFTALRVGASLVKGICYIHNIPLLTINTLDIIAAAYKKEPYDLIIPTIDARRNEAYISIIDQEGKHLLRDTPFIFTEQSFEAYQPKSILVCGNAADKAKRLISPQITVNYVQSEPKASDMIEIAEDLFHNKVFADVAYFSPNYVKPPNITTPKKKLIP